MKDEATRLSPAKLSALNKGALAACDARRRRHGWTDQQPARLQVRSGRRCCAPASETDACLTAPQIDAARKIYAYSTNPRTKEKIFPGMAPGSEITWTAMAGGPSPFPIPVDFYKYFVYSNPDWDWKHFRLRQGRRASPTRSSAKLLNAIDPDLGAVQEARRQVDHVSRLERSADSAVQLDRLLHLGDEEDGHARDRRLRAPVHGAGDARTAPAVWVRTPSTPSPRSSSGWRRGTKPAQIVASHMSNGVVDRTRPLCPYPQVASYKGSGSIDEAASFVCK